ncbi:MAG: hypothetical protein NE327_05970 [Lentisphaeraceae bacterium]|nr:hypothetical protein [Lentisphaeraceae bacterium]
MKIKFCILFLFANLFTVANAADVKTFLEPVFPVEQKLQQINGPNNVGTLTPGQIAEAFDKGGIKLSQQGALEMKNKIDDLEFVIFNAGSFPNAASIQSFINSGPGFDISLQAAQAIFNHLNGGPKIGANAHVFMMSLVASKTNAIINFFLQQLSDPKKPNSAAKRAIDNVLKKTAKLIKLDFKPQMGAPGANSGMGDWLGNAYMEVGTSYTVFDDIAANGSGKESSFNLTVGGDVGADSIVAFSLSKTYSHRGGDTSLTFESHGGDIMFHHSLNEYFGVGMYGFFQDTDIHEFESHAYAYGGGIMVTGMYDFGYFDVSTVQTLNKVWHKFGHDQLYVGSFNINRNWTDSLSTVFRASYTDSLKTDVDDDGDNSYWSVGGDVNWVINENASISLGYERIVALTDFRSHTFNLSFRWYF